ncbi:MAG: glycosyltransferase family 2 protein [Gemmatimonadaceae bacterium]|nr:glycosyltransferase family 2 protein [Gemmatimonadaceae bacterium]MCW5826228.1 glycosyltransferase family 2 protein [Gemmatimonadaceae bacterium]
MTGLDWLDAARTLLWWGDHAALVYLLLLSTAYAVLLLLSIPELWSHWRLAADEHLQRLLASDALPPLSLLVPAYNEEVTIGSSLLSFLTLEYPNLEVVVVNDGSKDATMQALMREFDLYEVPPAFPVSIRTQAVRGYYRSRRFARLLVIDKENGGKADSLNAAMNAARHPFVVAVDADTLIEPDALMRLARPFLLGANVAAVGGTIRVANDCTVEMGRVTEARVSSRWMVGCQVVEYLRAFLFGRLGWNHLGGNLIISGAFGLFRKKYLLAIGGYKTGNVTEDMDLVVRLHRYLKEHRIEATLPFIPDPVAWTEVPASARVLGRQRERWHRGLIGTLWAHRTMLFNPRYGPVGMLAVPFYVFGELIAPLVELCGWLALALGLALGAVDFGFALLFFLVAIGYGTILSIWAVLLEEFSFKRYRRRRDFWKLLGFAVVEGLGYRQMTVFFRLQSFWKHLRGVESWGKMTREGFGTKKPA